MSFVSCATLTSELAKKQDALKDCEGNPLDGPVPTCADLAKKQDALNDCEGNPLEGTVPTCAQMTAAIDAAMGEAAAAGKHYHAAGTNTTLTGTGTQTSPYMVNVPAASTTTAGVSELATPAEAASGTGSAAVPASALPSAIAALETTTTLTPSGKTYVYKNEDGTDSVVSPANFLSSAPGQSLSTGPDGGIYVNVIGMLPTDATYSGSTLGNVDITIEPDVNDPSIYTIRGDLDIAATTPTNGENMLKPSPSGFYVDAPQDASATQRGLVNLTAGQVLGAGVKTMDSLFTRKTANVTTFDLNKSDVFTYTATGSTTFAVSNVPAAGLAAVIILDLTNGGGKTLTWWAGMKWEGGTQPVLTSSGRDLLGFMTHDGGVTWSGLLLGKDLK